MIVKKIQVFLQVLVLQSGLQIKHSFVKSEHLHHYMSNERLQGEELLQSENHVLEALSSHAKILLKSATQKLNFLMAKSYTKKLYTELFHKCPCMFPHSYTLLLHLIFKYIKNKYEVTLNSFGNFTYVSSYMHLKDFAWKRD